MYYYFASLVLLAAVLALEYQFRRAIRTIAVFGVLAFILVSVLKYWLSYSAVALIMLLLASFFSMYWYAERRFYIFYAGIAAVAILFFVSSYYALGSSYTPMAFGLGAVFGLLYSGLESRKPSNYRQDKRTELMRDYIQVTIGVVLVAIIAISGLYGFYISFYLVLLGLLALGFAFNSRRKILVFFKRLERTGVFFGRGAIFLAIGFTILLPLYAYHRVLIFGILILLFCDPAATIFGIRYGKVKLPYNKNKSYAGTLAYFLLGAVFSFITIGYIGLALALLLALLESIPTRADDNITVSLVYGVLASIFV